ncbi:MAG: DUF4388 domain-containing protein [Gammaproteobacteria bacterium]|nr:DUF4388 domain-containing protein [Gammaproteobacteria bacterium]MCP5425769.1 DUF4388 domain-containing protein [Gammaproteobacteria bacterium]MCP5458620.1 DUF4388 domain-containing protein [Gammaproteobacteria bacterium]
MKTRFVPFAELIRTLWALHNTGLTGIIYITTDDDRSAQINFLNGEIVSLFLRNRQDEDAIPLLAELGWCRFRVAKMPVRPGNSVLPPTHQILTDLSAESAD